jgi:hypothetical protein
MKLSITFDAEDFRGMLVDFFDQAGYDIAPEALKGAKVAFNGIFPDGLSLTVTPGSPKESTELPEIEASIASRSIPQVVPEAEIESPTERRLPYTQVMDPEYAEVTQLESILKLSKTLEKDPQSK